MEQQMANLTKTINRLTNQFDCLQASQEVQALEIASKVSAETAKTAKNLQIIDMRMNETRGLSIHDENDRVIENIREKLLEKLALNDLPKFMGTEDPLIHIKAFKAKWPSRGSRKNSGLLCFHIHSDQ